MMIAWAGHSQHRFHHHHDQMYTTIEDFKQRYNRALTAEDSLNMRHIDGDLMVLLTPADLKKYIASDFEYRDKGFLEIYKKIAFNPRFKASDNNVYITYWKEPIKIYFSESIPRGVRKQFTTFVTELTHDIDSLKVSFVSQARQANYFIYCSGDFEFEPKLIGRKIEYYNYWNGRRQLYRTSVKLDKEFYFNDKLLLGSLTKLFVQSLGNFALTDAVDCDNHFSICESGEKKVSEFDRRILKYHYSYGICKGIDEATFDQLHQSALFHRKMNPVVPYKVWHQR